MPQTGGAGPAAGQKEKPARAPFNVLFVSVDTTRADHLGCYGHPVIRTPNIDRISAEGATFLQCVSSVPLTLPSHATMMTGVHPFVHGARDNGFFHLHTDNLTLPEVFKQVGYATAASIGAYVLNREFGLAQGFDTYVDISSLPRRINDQRQPITERNAEVVCESALEWLRANAGERFFLFVHFFDPHQPMEPPERYRSQYADPYLAEIAHVDEQFGRLMAALEELQVDCNTLVILTSDHGEGHSEHGEETHGPFVYDATLLVPLILWCPELIPAGRRITSTVRLVDVAPTILDLLQIDPLPDAQGTSLTPLISGAAEDLQLSAYSESLYTIHHFGMSGLRALRHGGWKYIHAPTPELYQVTVDPAELENFAAADPDRVARMRERLRSYIVNSRAVASGADSQREVDSETMSALQALGYVASMGTQPEEGEVASELDLFELHGPDPKDYVEFLRLASAALGMVRTGHEDAEKTLLEVIEKAPNPDVGFVWAYQDLAMICTQEARYEEAAKWCRRALRAFPSDGRTLTNLGEVLGKMGQLEEAISSYESALQLKPVFPETHRGLGAALTRAGRTDEALQHLRAALEIDPRLPLAHRSLGELHVRCGRVDEAIASYKRALELKPEVTQWRRELAAVLLSQGDESALEQYQEILRFDPNDASTCIGLGNAYGRFGQPQQAIESYHRALELDPRRIHVYDALGRLLQAQGQSAEAIRVFRKGLKVAPENANLANNLAWLLATASDAAVRDGAEAVRLARRACDRTSEDNPNFLDTLAAAYAGTGRFQEAVETIDRAIELATSRGFTQLAAEMQSRRQLYIENKPYRSGS